MRTCLATLLICFVTVQALSQDKTTDYTRPWWENRDTAKFSRTGYLAATYGFLDDGTPKNSPAIAISGAIPLKYSNFGFAGKVGYNSTSASGANSKFQQYYIAGGLFATFQLNKKYAFDVKLLGGIMYCHYPEQVYNNNYTYSDNRSSTTYDSTVFYNFDIKSANTFAFLFQAGIGFRYCISHKIGIMLNVDYMRLRAVFDGTLVTSYTGACVKQYNPSTGITNTTNYNFPNNPSSSPYTFEPTAAHNSGYTLFSLGIYYQLGDVVVIK